jgi:hypothetical protein
MRYLLTAYGLVVIFSVFAQAQNNSEKPHGNLYAYIGPGYHSWLEVPGKEISSGAALTVGGGGEFYIHRGFGIGLDFSHDVGGPLWRGLWHWDQIKLNGIYTFSSARRPRLNPFVTAGFSAGGCTVNWLRGFHAGGGIQYWFRPKLALRGEFLYQYLHLEKGSLFQGERRIAYPQVRVGIAWAPHRRVT